MAGLRRYRSVVFDSVRWEGFRFRPDDIVISTPAKSGTTWMQMLCALVVFDTSDLARPLFEISPWLDAKLDPLDEVVASLDAQRHRRFIKTHTPLDGLPVEAGVTYVCVGRDPRDVSQSLIAHMANLDAEAFAAARATVDDDGDLPPMPIGPPPSDPLAHFWGWAYGDPGEGGRALSGVLHHLATFWDHRDDPTIALFHYSDLLADLPGQLARLAALLGVDMAPDRVVELASTARFDRMKERADDLVGDGGVSPSWLAVGSSTRRLRGGLTIAPSAGSDRSGDAAPA